MTMNNEIGVIAGLKEEGPSLERVAGFGLKAADAKRRQLEFFRRWLLGGTHSAVVREG